MKVTHKIAWAFKSAGELKKISDLYATPVIVA